jgi:hypothetical protein
VSRLDGLTVAEPDTASVFLATPPEIFLLSFARFSLRLRAFAVKIFLI